ncbi:MAG: hypothetical protein R3F10_04010 [Lysobacteraceae bacterium]
MKVSGICAAALLLAACATNPPVAVEPEPPARDLLLEVRTAGIGEDALEVKLLRDAVVTDLIHTAEQCEAARDFPGADAALAKALEYVPGDPELTQWRAELALARGQYEAAATLAQHSFEHGPRLGGLCRRNWATLRIARELANDALGAQAAGEQLAQCTVAPPVRM